MKVAVVGATGMVGKKMLNVLAEMNFPITELYCAASARSVGRELLFGGSRIRVMSIEETLKNRPDIALFSAGSEASKAWAEKFAVEGCTVIDNSSAWRMDENIKLVVPEINGHELTTQDKIIANPNCSTIQLVLALKAVHDKYGLERVVVSTYQSVSGTGVLALNQLDNERLGLPGKMAYPYQIDLNCIPHGGDFMDDGYTTEELKLVNESRKILNDPDLKLTATVVRVPVKIGHSESVNVETKKPFDIKELREEIGATPGVDVKDIPGLNIYPMPIFAENQDDVHVGRIRRDDTRPNAFNMWVVADNLRKGAASNAVQIALKVSELL